MLEKENALPFASQAEKGAPRDAPFLFIMDLEVLFWKFHLKLKVSKVGVSIPSKPQVKPEESRANSNSNSDKADEKGEKGRIDDDSRT